MSDLNIQDFLETAKIGVLGSYEIVVHTDDIGSVLHFHIIDSKSKEKEFEAPIMIVEAKYCFHNKSVYRLSNEMIKLLVKFLKSEHACNHGLKCSNWGYLIAIWNDNNTYQLSGLDMPMLDYTLLNKIDLEIN